MYIQLKFIYLLKNLTKDKNLPQSFHITFLMKIIISIIFLLFAGIFIYIYTWDIPVPEKKVKKEINILDFKK